MICKFFLLKAGAAGAWLPITFGVFFAIAGTAFAVMSVSASNDRIDKCFKGLLNGF